MKVYIVFTWYAFHEGTDIVEIFQSENEAKEFLEDQIKMGLLDDDSFYDSYEVRNYKRLSC